MRFKLDVLRFKQDTGASYKDTANAFGITEPSIMANWKRQFVQEGTAGLNKPIGRPPKMPKPNLNQDKRKPDQNKKKDSVQQENELLKKMNIYELSWNTLKS